MTIQELAHTILRINRTPISRVRFARIIYFVHKELIRKKFMTPEDIAYIRSPLGPIPEGFATLAENSLNIIVSHRDDPDDLSYTAEEYAVRNHTDAEIDAETTMLEQYRDILNTIENTLKTIRGYTTPELIQTCHREPSWLAHANGELYYITPEDLKKSLPTPNFSPIRIKIRLIGHPSSKKSAMQANLLRGMIADIVKESTDLEYPNDAKTNTAKQPKQKTARKLKIIKLPDLHLKILQRSRESQKNQTKPERSKNPKNQSAIPPQKLTNSPKPPLNTITKDNNTSPKTDQQSENSQHEDTRGEL